MGKKGITIGINLLVFLFCFLLLELLTGLFYRNIPDTWANGKIQVERLQGEPPTQIKAAIQAHPYLLYTNTPDYKKGKRVLHNSLGYRNPEFELKKGPGTIRILVLGGSTTYGYLNPKTETTWPAILEAKLQENSPQNIEVINGGLNYATSAEILAAYTFKHRYLEADWIIYHGGLNDAAVTISPNYDPEYAHFRDQGTQISSRPSERKLLRSNTLKLVYAFWLNSVEPIYQSQPLLFKDLDPDEVAQSVRDTAHYQGFQRNLDLLLQMAKLDSSRVLLAGSLYASTKKIKRTRPDLSSFLEDYLLAVETNKGIVQTLGKQYGIPYLDFDIKAFPDPFFYDYCHLKAKGEAIKAEAIYQKLYPLLH